MEQESLVQFFGQIESNVGLHRLRKVLAQGGLQAEVRESVHYEGGRYLRVCEWDEFALERVGAGEYLVHADVGPAVQICHIAFRLSLALADAGIRHRFEVYNEGGNQLVHYFGHCWPRTDA
jgi:hypothetical protein